VPQPIQTGQVDEAVEGLLVRISGAVAGFSRSALTLDDGSGPAAVVFREGIGFRRPWVERGQVWTAVGVVGQYTGSGGESGYRVLPRFVGDVVAGPGLLPVTGAAEPPAAERITALR
jgi:hypothetical protein